jgi:anti-sigma factor RsiW
MTNDPNPPREATWRKLSEAKAAELQAWLSAHPEAQAEWDTDVGLTDALTRLPDAPVASNFTARVLHAVEREGTAESQTPALTLWQRWQRRWKWALAGAAAVAVAGLLVVHQQQDARRAELANSVVKVSSVVSLPSPAILQDFEAIRALKTTPARLREHGLTGPAQADEQILALLQ